MIQQNQTVEGPIEPLAVPVTQCNLRTFQHGTTAARTLVWWQRVVGEIWGNGGWGLGTRPHITSQLAQLTPFVVLEVITMSS